MKSVYSDLIRQYRRVQNSGGDDRPEFGILREGFENSWFYGLSPDRANVIEAFPWQAQMDVLEIGADYGVFASLSERVHSYSVLDPDEEHLELIRRRFPDRISEEAGGIRLFKDNAPGKFDVVICSLLDLPKETKLRTWVREAAQNLKVGGTLLLIADNENALQFMTGAKRDPDRLYITAQEIEQLKTRLGFRTSKDYYPLPNAAFAKNIFSDTKLPSQGDFRGISESYTQSRYVLCREEEMYENLTRAGAFPQLAPSFLIAFMGYKDASEVEICVSDDLKTKLPSYVRYNRMRAAGYALKTELFEKNGKKYILKTALDPEANAHIEGFAARAEFLKKSLDPRIEVLLPEIGRNDSGLSYAKFEFLEGMDLGKELSLLIRDGAAPVEEIRQSIRLLLGDEEALCCNMDALFENVIASENRLYLIDYEWVFESGVDRDYLVYRILKTWYLSYKDSLTAYADAAQFLSVFGIDAVAGRKFEEKEASFQSYVLGTCRELEEKYRMNQVYAQDAEKEAEKLKNAEEQIVLLKDEISEHKTALSKEREVERLSQNHIRNIELINKTQQEQLTALTARVGSLERHQSIPARIGRKLIGAIDRWAPAGSRKRVLIHYTKDTLRHPFRMLKLYLNGQGRILISGDFDIGGEFHEGGLLAVPQTEAPLVSIVIPAYNQVAYTYACVRSILANTDFETCPYEIILADDVSTDATKEISRYISGMVISRNTSNMGFLKNCNQAAAKARGKYIFFLNNDTKVHEHWLDSLVRLIESDESIGMVGSKLVYPDGRLQEAGGIIWSDASGWNYGRLDDPSKPEYNYVKDVDYISGAAIMLSRALWEEIGGFDERFAPAYCEDSDLAFEVRRHGKRVVLQPQSVITHFEGISNGTDVNGTGLKRYQVVNAEKFREKWAEVLKDQQENTGNPDPFTARDRSGGKPCIVFVDHYVPTWDRDAGSKTTWQYLTMFVQKGWNVKFVGDNFLHEEPYTSQLQQMGIEVIYGPEYENTILDWFKKNRENIKICYLNRPHIAVKYIDFLKKETKIKCIFYGHDLHFLRLRREYELTGEVAKLRESNYWKSVEFSVMQAADMVYYPSQTEIDEIHRIHPEIPAKAITAYLWDSFETEANNAAEDYRRRKDLLFVGGFRHPPNADAVKWFVRSILPKIRESIPGIRFLVAGSGADEEILSLNSEENGVEILGFVSDERLKELYASTRLTVVPLRYGAGVKGKVVEAIYNNSVVVTTSVGAEGIPEADQILAVTDDQPEHICENSAEVEKAFVNAVLYLYQNAELCSSRSRRCRSYIEKHYSLKAAWSVIEEDLY